MRACWRCHTLTETVTLQHHVWLCAGCPVLPPCERYMHRYRGAETAGIFACVDCGSCVQSEAISTKVVESTSQYYVDC